MLAIAYRLRNLPQASLNLTFNIGIAGYKYVKTAIVHMHVGSEVGRLSEVRQMRFASFWQSRFYPEPDKTASGGSRRHKCHEQTKLPKRNRHFMRKETKG